MAETGDGHATCSHSRAETRAGAGAGAGAGACEKRLDKRHGAGDAATATPDHDKMRRHTTAAAASAQRASRHNATELDIDFVTKCARGWETTEQVSVPRVP